MANNFPLPLTDAPADASAGPNVPRDRQEPDTNDVEHPHTTLKRHVYIMVFVAIYASTAIFAWTLTCVAFYRPETDRLKHKPTHFGFYDKDTILRDGRPPADVAPRSEFRSDLSLKLIRFFQSAVSVVTVPLISAVCSQAAVVYVQRRAKSKDNTPTLRQVAALSDKSWNDSILLAKLCFSRDARKRYGSRFLWLAVGLTVFGAIINPLEAATKTSEFMHVPMGLQLNQSVVDTAIRFQPGTMGDADPVAVTRSKLSLRNATNIHPKLWSFTEDCVRSEVYCNIPKGPDTLTNMNKLVDPFWSDTRPGLCTGLVRQFAPRVNSTATLHAAVADEFEEACHTQIPMLYLRYNYSNPDLQLEVEVCMPSNNSQYPWKPQRERQDFHEDIYLKVTSYDSETRVPRKGPRITHVFLNTTLGYYELPNYINERIVDRIASEDPSEICGNDCQLQEMDLERINRTRPINNTTVRLAGNRTRGPLLTVALALFDQGPFAESSRLWVETTSEEEAERCERFVPMAGLIRIQSANTSDIDQIFPCYGANDTQSDAFAKTLDSWFFSDVSTGSAPNIKPLQNAFNVAAFLANDAILNSSHDANIWQIRSDEGSLQEGLFIRIAYLVPMSVLLGCYLACLLALAAYSVRTARWTRQLDALAMMKMGASKYEYFPLLVARDPEDVVALDDLPGWVGDGIAEAKAQEGQSHESESDEGNGLREIGTLELGGSRPLSPNRLYPCHKARQQEPPHSSGQEGTEGITRR